MSSNDLSLKLDNLLQNDDTENFYSLISEIIEENKDNPSELNEILNDAFLIISDNLNESNQEKKLPFICLFFEILISENIDFSLLLEKTFSILTQNDINSDENIKRIINICSNATIKKKDLFNSLILFSKNKLEYLYIIFSLAGFKDLIIDKLSDNWELIISLLDNSEIKANSNSIKTILKCLELLINLSGDKFRPYASSALYQALDYLTETDTELQKRSLMIIYSLTKYCDEQLQPLSENIIDFLKVLQNGNNIEINNLCNTMLKHFMGENEEEYENEENIQNMQENENENENQKDMDLDNGNNNEYENENINEDNKKSDKKEELNNQQDNEEYEEENYDNINYNEKDGGEEEQPGNAFKTYAQEEKEEKEEKEEEVLEQKIRYEQPKYKKEKEDINDKSNNKYNYKNEENEEENEFEQEENKYNYNKRNNSNKNEEEENDERDNRRENIKEDKNNKENNFNNIDINAIIRKIKDLSDKQIIILDSIEQYKRDTKRIINQKKLKIQSLEAKIEELQEKIRIEKNKKRNKQGKTNYQMKRKNNNNNYDDEDDNYNYDY